ncbi:AraC family transcriptional regulator [Nocardia panacis]|uniref:AraC family transcriptional regulator n=1 Tax=Nocardia panacis TaxID=2340916 RepID=A0A3A4K8N4_9NOCA|nr:helix-turn-helix domain-containing protein [Nocardia panacis]RJO71047.1 AraC family transcriptional regulator [Nocardia panacis]
MEQRIRSVRYAPPAGAVGEIEVGTLAGIRERGGPREFLAPQRLDFDLLFRIGSGHAVHTVDFTGYPLEPGDVLWVRAGQVQQWGRIAAIEGPVFLFTAAAIGAGTAELIRGAGVSTPNYWPAASVEGPPALALAAAAAEPRNAMGDQAIRAAARSAALAAALLHLIIAAPEGSTHGPATREAFLWFRDEVDARFRTRHKVADYAARLGYSTHTLNRLARENTGMSAKEFIDERILLEAKRLLAHGRDPVARIAEDLGFDDPSNFSKYFHQRTGLTPAAFRARSWPAL